ncbi:hypothetical protein BH708_10400 [Brachybacterium sp. P6-10-X1]|nr:hypothetical protein BH708_10400 [Brachybacterium sp. P6-10-X1]
MVVADSVSGGAIPALAAALFADAARAVADVWDRAGTRCSARPSAENSRQAAGGVPVPVLRSPKAD